MSQTEHKAQAPASVRCFVLTVSDTRTDATDTSGRAIAELLTERGHVIVGREIVRDEPIDVARIVAERAADPAVQVVITTGGTGITARDGTYEAISALLQKRLDGFGELFRVLSFEEIGPAAMMSRACAGTIGRTIVLSLPGSENAVRLAMNRLILPELGHLVQQVNK